MTHLDLEMIKAIDECNGIGSGAHFASQITKIRLIIKDCHETQTCIVDRCFSGNDVFFHANTDAYSK